MPATIGLALQPVLNAYHIWSVGGASADPQERHKRRPSGAAQAPTLRKSTLKLYVPRAAQTERARGRPRIGGGTNVRSVIVAPLDCVGEALLLLAPFGIGAGLRLATNALGVGDLQRRRGKPLVSPF